jgi:hypothetical protein
MQPRVHGESIGASGMSNSHGSYRTTIALAMRAFDKLPLEVRRALAGANQNYAPQPFLTALRRGVSVDCLVERVRRADKANAGAARGVVDDPGAAHRGAAWRALVPRRLRAGTVPGAR